MREEMMENGERSATFLIRVNKKPNEPWQGNVIWVSERCEQTFTSMQELFSLMGDTLQKEEQE